MPFQDASTPTRQNARMFFLAYLRAEEVVEVNYGLGAAGWDGRLLCGGPRRPQVAVFGVQRVERSLQLEVEGLHHPRWMKLQALASYSSAGERCAGASAATNALQVTVCMRTRRQRRCADSARWDVVSERSCSCPPSDMTIAFDRS